MAAAKKKNRPRVVSGAHERAVSPHRACCACNRGRAGRAHRRRRRRRARGHARTVTSACADPRAMRPTASGRAVPVGCRGRARRARRRRRRGPAIDGAWPETACAADAARAGARSTRARAGARSTKARAATAAASVAAVPDVLLVVLHALVPTLLVASAPPPPRSRRDLTRMPSSARSGRRSVLPRHADAWTDGDCTTNRRPGPLLPQFLVRGRGFLARARRVPSVSPSTTTQRSHVRG